MPLAVPYGPRENQSKVNKSERENQTACGVTYRWNVGMDANELAYESRREMYRPRKPGLWLPKGEGGWEVSQRLGTNSHT